MTLQKPVPKSLSKPLFPRFLIALFLAKSRPTKLSIQEYLSALRSYIKQGRRLASPTDLHAYVDTAAYWRDAYKKSEDTQLQLRAKILNLELAQNVTRSQERASAIGTTSRGKRKRCENEVEAMTCPKPLNESRVATQSPSSCLQLEPLQFAVDTLAKSSSSQDPDVFLDKFLLFQQIASQKVPNSTSLASALSQVCSGIRKTISRVTCSQNLNSPTYISHPVTRSQQSNSIHVEGVLDQELDKKLTAFRRIFPYLLKAVRKPSQAAKSESFQAHLTYSFIELFRDILEHICVLSAADSVSSRTPHQLQKSRRSTRAKPQVATSQRANLSREKPTTKLCQLFISLMTALETSDTIDRDVLEGLIYFLIHRVGDTLKIFVFGDDKNEVLAPKGSNRTSDSQALTYDEERKNAEARAPYLIYILSHVIPFATGQSHASLTSKAPLVAISNFPSHKKSLSSQSTESLQSTLVTALFGSAYAAEFIESISQPICPENQAEEGRFGPKIIDQDVEKWFKEEVWRILGWEILAGSIAW